MSGWNAQSPKKTSPDNRLLSWGSIALTILAGLGLISLLWFKMTTATSAQVRPTHSLEQIGTAFSSAIPDPTATITPTPAAASPNIDSPRESNSDPLIRFCRDVPYPKWEFDADLLSLPTDPSSQAQVQFTDGKVAFRPSCTFEPGNQPEYIILHSTGGSTLEGAVATLRKENGASIHYIIDRDGTVVQMLPESLGAHHVTCQMEACLPTKSIGIELVNRGHVNLEAFHGLIYEDPLRAFNYPYWEDYPLAQRQALEILVEDISIRWGIVLDQEHVLGHFQLNHKTDPGPALNLWWQRPGDLLPPIFDINQ